MEMTALPMVAPNSPPSPPSSNAPPAPERSAYERLSPRDRAILDEYLQGKSRTAAVRAAFPHFTSPDSVASKWFAKPLVKEAIAECSSNVLDAIGVSKFMIAKAYAVMAFGDVRELYDARGKLKPMHQLTEEQASLIASLETEHVQLGDDTQPDLFAGDEDLKGVPIVVTKKLKRWDRKAALDALKDIAAMGSSAQQHADTIFNVQINY